ncbi:MAG: DUF1080 domain-containing protein [Niabella sp.]
MKKIFLLLFSFICLSVTILAQADVRTTETKIADLLMQIPPQNSANLEKVYKELTALGAPAVKNIASKLVSPGKGNDAVMRDAISGMVMYAGQMEDVSQRRSIANALATSLSTAKDDEVRDFLLQELQYVASNDVVPVVKKYLTSSRLADPAARVLQRINTNTSKNALLYALSASSGKPQLTLIEAVGDMAYAPAAKQLLRLWPKLSGVDAKKVLLRAMAQIGDMSSESILQSAALKSGYKYSAMDATGSYLVFLQNQLAKGNKSYVTKAATSILSIPSIPEQIQSAALSLLAKAEGQNAESKIFEALKNDNKKISGTAASIISELYTPGMGSKIGNIIQTSNSPELQTSLINLLGKKEDAAALPLLTQLLNSKSSPVQLAAINAIAKAGKSNAVSPLIQLLLQNGTNAIGETAKNALLTIAGDQVVSAVAAALPQASAPAKIALMNILAQRKASQYTALIFNEAQNSDASVQEVAATSLSSIVAPKDINQLATLLNNNTTPSLTKAYQQAITSAIQQLPEKLMQVTTAEKLMQDAGSKDYLYYNALSNIGSNQALNMVVNNFYKGTQQQKEAALSALANWTDGSALDALYKISKNSTGADQSKALNSFIAGINKSNNTTDEKVLMFRNAMELASSLAQKRNILSGISQNSTLQSLLFVSKYFDNTELRQNAVQAVINIVLDHKELYGKNVAAIAQKAIELNTDTESDYLKQALIRHLAALPKEEGFVAMFNGKDLAGWKGLVENPIKRANMSVQELAEKQQKADEQMRKDWKVQNGVLVFEGEGYNNLVSEKKYEDFELYVDWRMEAKGDGGVYLRGSPQVQTWDTSRVEVGAQVGSGGLYNNKVNRSTPLMVADNPIGEWNTFRIKMIGDKVTVYLNGQLVTDNVTLENYWDRNLPIFDKEAIELQAHGTRLEFRDVYVKEIPRAEPYEVSTQEKKEGFVPLFNGVNLNGWTGNKVNYYAQEGMIIANPGPKPPEDVNKNIYTEKEYSDFIMRFEFQLTPGANNGLGIRTPTEGDAAYVGMELQILDNEAPIYKDLKPYQYHGSVYGIIPALRGYLKPIGEWNYQEVKAIGNHITITLNGKVILDGNIAEASKNNTETADHKLHPGLLNKSGHIGFLGHGSPLKFRNLRIKDLSK